jgi:pyruvate/2-oxoglutarate dehydrogenase complex dihydrolipoamide acyltransferase (E2) component
VKFLIANGEGPDTVVTNIAYNLDAETMELQFTPMRGVNDEEYALVQAARSDPATREMIVLTVAAQEAAPAKAQEAAAPKPKVVYSDEPDDEEEEVIAEPKKRAAKKGADVVVPQGDLASVLNAWGDGDEDE